MGSKVSTVKVVRDDVPGGFVITNACDVKEGDRIFVEKDESEDVPEKKEVKDQPKINTAPWLKIQLTNLGVDFKGVEKKADLKKLFDDFLEGDKG